MRFLGDHFGRGEAALLQGVRYHAGDGSFVSRKVGAGRLDQRGRKFQRLLEAPHGPPFGRRSLLDLVAPCPVDALPAPQTMRLDVEEPALLVQRRLEIFRAVLAQVTDRHPLGDRDPTAAYIGLLDKLGLALGDDFTKGAALVNGYGAPRIVLEMRGPRGLLP